MFYLFIRSPNIMVQGYLSHTAAFRATSPWVSVSDTREHSDVMFLE